MKFASQNLQPFQLRVVKVAQTGQTINANLGNAATPFHIERESVPVLIRNGDYHSRYFRSTKYVEATMTLTKQEIETLYRMVSAVDLGYALLLSLPMLNISVIVTAEVLTALVTIGDETYYQLSFYDTPVQVGWWRRFCNRFDKKAKEKPLYQLTPNPV